MGGCDTIRLHETAHQELAIDYLTSNLWYLGSKISSSYFTELLYIKIELGQVINKEKQSYHHKNRH